MDSQNDPFFKLNLLNSLFLSSSFVVNRPCDSFFSVYIVILNEVHQKDNISRIIWYSDWLHNTTSAGNSIFVTNHNTTSCGRSIMQPIRLP